MGKYTDSQLLEQNIRNVEHEGEKWFSIFDINKIWPHTKFEPINVRILPYDADEIKFIRSHDVEEMSDLDLRLMSSIFNKPK